MVGYGYWGPNIVRNLMERPEFRLMALCERDEARDRGVPAAATRRCGSNADFEAALRDDRVEAVAIATPPRTHYTLVRKALEAGKHVLVEKPLATHARQAAELVELADERDLVLMPGHTFLYSPPVNKVRDLMREDVLGEVYFVTSARMNLGKYQRDGVVSTWSRTTSRSSCTGSSEPVAHVTATGRSVFQAGVPETAFLTLTFASGTQANLQMSWLAPRKMRQMTVVGTKRMVHYEDTAADESVRIYDRGLDFDEAPSNFGEYQLTYRTGDMVAPRIDAAEPLALELQDFARAVREGTVPTSNARIGLEIVQVIEAADLSLQNDGLPVEVPPVGDLIADLAGAQPSHNGNGHSRAVNGNGKGRAADGTTAGVIAG